ncbi:MAG: DUF1269 domain-containing protein [gamma proteobacterium symbiont of Bathyaustriella thionipta]|nr:DUF1269 domain-containing protein [gamma proteobacterium symbiont of Bathyaustriella thionipta]
MKRLYFLLPELALCRTIIDELLAQGIAQSHLHVIANSSHSLEGLPKATAWQKSDVKYGIELGIGMGGMAGLLGGLLAVSFPPSGLVLAGGATLAGGALAGASFGGLVSALMRSHEHNHELDAFESAVMDGDILLLVDVPRHEVEAVKQLVTQHHPEVQIGLAEPRKI